MAEYDRVFVGGVVHDGTGSPGVPGSVAVKNGRLHRLPAGAKVDANHVHDVTGQVVAPGFIDVHSHTDFNPFVDPVGMSKAFDGVTLEISGNCGFSAIPFDVHTREEEHRRFRRYGTRFDWEDMTGYREAVERSGTSIHRGMLVGHGNLRTFVMGQDARAPTAAEMDRMKGVLGDLLDQGALGFSSGLIYPPGCFAETSELVELAKVVAGRGKIYTSHIRGEGDNLEPAIDEALTICEQSGVRTQISHLKTSGARNWHKMDRVLARIESFIERGLPVMADRYPYTATNTFLYTLFRKWVYDGGIAAQMARLQDPSIRVRVLDEMAQDYTTDYYGKILVSSTRMEGAGAVVGKTLEKIAGERGVDPRELAIDLFLQSQGDLFVIYFNLSEENLRKVLTKDWVMVASDGTAQIPEGEVFEGSPHPRAYGTFSRTLGHFVREAGIMSLETGIAKMTGMPARHFDLKDRGFVKDGYWADLTIFDPVRIKDLSTFEKPHQLSAGVEWLVVAGEPVIARGRLTDARPGAVI